jgi:DNA-binding NarL/FixJ family response regulator
VAEAPAGPERPLRVLVVDDHPMVREGLRSMLGAEGIEVAGEAGSGADGLQRAAELAPDLILLDLELPDMDGLSVLARLREQHPRLPVLVVTMHGDPQRMRRAVQAGAAGYVLKGVDRQELLAGVRAICSGGSVLDTDLLRAALAPEAPAGGKGAPASLLSAVEVNLVRLIAEGLTNREIAARTRWSHATVKKYVQRVIEKLGVSDRTHAAVEALRRGLLG